MTKLGTGSIRELDRAFFNLREGFQSTFYSFDYPLDAPEILSSGSMNSTEWVDYKGNPLASQSEHLRG